MDKNNGLNFDNILSDLEAKISEVDEAIETLDEKEQKGLSSELNGLREELDALLHRRFDNLAPWQRVAVARHPERPLISNYIEAILDEILELHGDRNFRDDPALLGAFARIEGRPFLFLGHRKGKSTREKVDCNFGSPHPEGYRKAMRLMKLAAKFNLPIVTLINTPGAYPGIGAEERGQAQAIAECLQCMSMLPVPIVCVTIGEGGSGGALGIGVGDRLLILEHAYYSVISPEGCAAILWRDTNAASRAAEALRLTAKDLLDLGIVDEVLPEPVGGAHRDPQTMAQTLKEAILRHLDELATVPPKHLVEQRYQRLRQIGQYVQVDVS